MNDETRIERDSMGEVEIPAWALWGAQTQRAVENFPISGQRFGRRFICALGMIKGAAAVANAELGLLDEVISEAIVDACQEIVEGEWDDHFPIDIFQTGSGTSTNMNANEVIANRAIQIMGGEVGSRSVHPNDYVNKSQSSNDVIPTAIHIAAVLALEEELIPALDELQQVLKRKAKAFDGIIKTGRTHLQDATPIRLGQEFKGYAHQADLSATRATEAATLLCEIPIGGTAVGTGMNCPKKFPEIFARVLNDYVYLQFSNEDFFPTEHHFDGNAARDALVETSGFLKTIAVSLHKIANDIRFLGSGPRNGFGEIKLPAVQPGSSIMPGKVNPVMAEALIMVCAHVIGNDAAITLGGLGGYFELNTMMPLIAHNLLNSIEWMAAAVRAFTERCVTGIEANAEKCAETVERGLALATALAPHIGYDRAAEVAKEALKSGRTVREVAEAWEVLPPDKLEAALDARKMTEPGL
jgi:fumarate hydratase class II